MISQSPQSTKETVSVIVPMYNRERYIIRTLTGVWDQTYRPIELVVVDDGSTDNSVSVVRAWMAEHTGDNEFVTHLIQQENRGVSAARNAGFDASAGEYIHFLDSDDVPLPVMYERQVSVLDQDPECDHVWSGWRQASNEEEIEETIAHVLATDARPSLGKRVKDTPVSVFPGLFRRRSCDRIGGFDEELRSHEDWLYTCRVLQQQLVIRQLPNALMVIRNHSDPRASHFSQTRSGVVGKLQAAASVEAALPPDADFRRALLLRLAVNAYRCLFVSIMLPDRELADTCTQALRRNIVPWMPFSFRYKMRALDIVYSLFGCRGAAWFWESMKRLASFPALKSLTRKTQVQWTPVRNNDMTAKL